jgi:hypothetical protein
MSRQRSHLTTLRPTSGFLMSAFSFPTPLHVPMESAKTVAGRPSCSTAGLIGKMSLLSSPATPGTLPAHTSTATPAPLRPPPSSAAHKSARPGPSWLTTSPRIASTMRTSCCLLHAGRPRSVYRSARTCAPLSTATALARGSSSAMTIVGLR